MCRLSFALRCACTFAALQAAAYRGHGAVVKLLLNSGAGINRENAGEALHAAASEGHKTVVQLLLRNGADVNAQGKVYGTALQAAAHGGHEAVVKALINENVNVDARGGEYGNALQAAAYRGHEAIVKLLIENGADVNAQVAHYGNALQATAYRGHETILKLLLDNNADINAQGGQYGNALQAAAYRGQEAVVKLLLDNGADVNAEGGVHGTALCGTAMKGNVNVLHLLLKAGARINPHGPTYCNAAYVSAVKGHSEATTLLINHITQWPDTYGISRLQYLAYLLVQIPDGDSSTSMNDMGQDSLGRSLLHFAAMNRSKQVVTAYIRSCGSLEVTDHFGWTPLHWAMHVGNVDSVLSLCANGSNTNAQDLRGKTPVDLAVDDANQVMVDAILPFVSGMNKMRIRARQGPKLGIICDSCAQVCYPVLSRRKKLTLSWGSFTNNTTVRFVLIMTSVTDVIMMLRAYMPDIVS